jgi:AcrR family transcriptional regulator
MNLATRRSPDETRSCILACAWDLFRQLGYRTTIADIAGKLGMSSANIYRFFPSKQALSEAVCVSVLGKLFDAARDTAIGGGSAGSRLRGVLLTLYFGMRDQMLNEKRVHEVVDVAMVEGWPSIDAFIERSGQLIGRLIAEGQESGEFGPGDPGELAALTLQATVAMHHPAMIVQCLGENPDPEAEAIVAFALRALSNKTPQAGALT